MTTESSANSSKALSAANTVASLLPQIAAAAAGASVLGLFAGWREATAYFSGLGAPWFVASLSPTMLVGRAVGLVGMLGLFAFLSIYNLSLGHATAKGLRRWSIILLVIAMALFVAEMLPDRWISKNTAYVCSMLGALVVAISAGLTIGEVVARLADSGLAWNGYQVWLLYSVVFLGLMQAPDRMGAAKAQLDGDIKNSGLPKIEMSPATPGKEWRLVYPLGSQLLVMSLGEKIDAHTFRVVDANAVIEIRSSRDKR
jgi:hypothetical protein